MQIKATISQLNPRKGGYSCVIICKEIVAKFPKGKSTRLLAVADNKLEFNCAFISLGNGDFYIILSKAKLKKLEKEVGDTIDLKIKEHPSPLGAYEPEVLTAYLEQDEFANSVYNKLTDGKKRSMIYHITQTKNIDIQIKRIVNFLTTNQNKA